MKNRSSTKKNEAAALVVTARIARQILVVRGQKVIVDADLAALYDTPTKRLNEQVKRNRGRFPDDFVFQLDRAERDEVVANCDHLRRLKFSPTVPFAFTEHGALMAASVLSIDKRGRVHVAKLTPKFSSSASRRDPTSEVQRPATACIPCARRPLDAAYRFATRIASTIRAVSTLTVVTRVSRSITFSL
jgi:hypothetical protein